MGYSAAASPADTPLLWDPVARLIAADATRDGGRNEFLVKGRKPRIRHYHHKTRTGCITCKQRKVKCDEDHPFCQRCLRTGRECGGYGPVPQARIFNASPSSNSTGPGSESPPTNHTSRFNSRKSGSRSITRSPPGPYASQSEKHSHDYFLHFIRHYTSPRSRTDMTVWTELLPQIAWEYTPLRHAMMACGFIGRSLIRRDSPPDYERAVLASTEYANRAIRGLTGPGTPLLFLMIAAWTFWQLDLMRGYVTSSSIHIQCAYSMATKARQSANKHEENMKKAMVDAISSPFSKVGLGTEEMVVSQLIVDSNASSDFTMQLESLFPSVLAPQESAESRQGKAVLFLQHSLERVAEVMDRFDLEERKEPSGQRLWTVLDRSKRELRWVLNKWVPGSHEWVTGRTPDEDAIFQQRETMSNLYTPYLESIGTGRFELWQLDMECARVLPVFLLRVAQDDVEMRQDLAEFMEAVTNGRI